MGAVHGCSLKYVFMAALYASLTAISTSDYLTMYLCYAALLSIAIAAMFQIQTRPILGKANGLIPLWSYLLFAPFHLPSLLYTYLHSQISPVPYASEVLPGYWVGSKYGDKITAVKQWDVTVDLTCEFPEPCLDTTTTYVNCPVWDGTPPSSAQLERAATAIAKGWSHATAKGGKVEFKGTVMVHCAHGRGRSCMVACAGLVKAGYCDTWEEAFDVVVKGRSCCKLNGRMRKGLTEWMKTQ